ncbi:TRAP transporter large permease [Mesobacillus maritimus]|uniref:TRAP transporter large permease n=1 Tax=Mesobacillus maritimus TaxID=1643336 RepID=UPI00203A7D18|nr:TRAP transporter large permease [Mesobacillus maritimus]MCM3670955.1 TRAP transporter large permease [Mesobacillus maritimus]
MPDVLLMVIILGLFTLLLLSGLHIHSLLLGIGILGLVLLEGPTIISGFLRADPFSQVASYTLTTIPLFVLMAQFIMNAGIVQDAFTMVYNFSKGKAGLLGSMTIVVGGLLGAVSGSGTATAASLGQVAVPELRNYGFKKEIAGAVAAVSGSLSGIIPPSITLILYGVITETPISDLFIGAVIPGILMMLVFIVCILFAMGRSGAASQGTFTAKALPLSKVLVVTGVGVASALIIFGGIYTGLITPTEAGAVGAFVAFISALLLGKVNKTFIINSVKDTAKVTGMVIVIIIGAKIFSRFMSLSLWPRKLVELLQPLLEYPILVLILLSAIFFILFMFIEGAAVILMTLPVLLPVIEAIQVDTLWFGVFICVISTLGLLTPPVGLSVYAVAGAGKLSVESVFRHTTAYSVVVAIIVCAAMILIPEIVSWLPGTVN